MRKDQTTNNKEQTTDNKKPVSLRFTLFATKKVFTVIKWILNELRTILVNRWRHLSRKRKVAFLIALAIIVYVLPSPRFTLKVTGFLRKDFIRSTSDSAFETRATPFYRVLIGDNSDKTKTQLQFLIEGKKFKMDFLPESSTASKSAEPLLTQADTESTASSTASAMTSPAVLGILKQINDQIASLSADITEITKKVDNIRKEVIDVVGSNEQTFIGPLEVIRHKGEFFGEIYYKLEKEILSETWEVEFPQSSRLDFRVDLLNYTLIVNPDQTWDLYDGEKKILTIQTLMKDKHGQTVNLPIVDEQRFNQSNKAIIASLILPEEGLDRGEIQIVRQFLPVLSASENTPEKQMHRWLGEEIATRSAFISSDPQLLASYQDNILVYDAKDQSVYLAQEGRYEPLLINIDVKGLSCNETQCIVAQENNVRVISPSDLSHPATQKAADATDSGVLMEKAPIGSISQSKDSVYGTENISPNGTVWKMKNLESRPQEIYKDIAYPTLISVSSNGKYIAFMGDGTLHVNKPGDEPKTITFGERIHSLSFGQNSTLYLIVSEDDADKRMVLKYDPETGLTEMLTNAEGLFTAILGAKNNLVIAGKIDEQNGVLIKLPYEQLEWRPYL